METLDFTIVKELVDLFNEKTEEDGGCIYGIAIRPTNPGAPAGVGWDMRLTLRLANGRIEERDCHLLDSLTLTANQALQKLIEETKTL